MTLKSVEKVETNIYELEVAIDAETMVEAAQKKFNESRKKIALPGFRKGKAPRNLIEKMYGENYFFETAFDDIVLQPAVSDAIDESKLNLVDNPKDLDVKELSKDGALFTFKVTTKPEVEISDYKGIKAEKANVRVEKKEIDAELDTMRQRGAREITVEDRAAQDGDITDIDFEGFVDGVAFDGGKGESYPLTLGSGQFIPGFEEQIVGHNIGEEFDVNVKFPEEYGAEELAGKDATFKVKLNGIKFRELPELDDEFAKDVSEDCDTLEDLKKSIKKDITERKQKKADDEFRSKCFDVLVENLKAEIPEVMIDNRAKEDEQNFAQRIGMQGGIDLDTYLMYIGMEKEAFLADIRVQAERNVKISLALEKIVELENIEVTDEDLDKEYTKLAEMYNMEADKVKAILPAENLKSDIALDKAADFVVDNAVAEKPKKAPAKKKEEAAE